MGILLPAQGLAELPDLYKSYHQERDRTPNRRREDATRGSVAEQVAELEAGWEEQYREHLDLGLDGAAIDRGELSLVFDRPITPEIVSATLELAAERTGIKAGFVWVVPQEESLMLMLILPGEEAIVKTVEVKNTELKATVQEFVRTVTNPRTLPERYQRLGRSLYQWIVAPLEADLAAANVETLVFCMGEGLRTLPVAALYDGEEFLVERYDLGVVPAFSLTDMVSYQPLKEARVLAMGASEFQPLQNQAPLPAVAIELATITEHLWPGVSFLNQEFTRSNLEAQRQQQPFKIIHLATHANFESGDLQNSYIQLWNSRLTLDQLGSLHLNSPLVELLVLSACRTAIGDAQAELGFAGLAVKAGVRSTLASLWFVSDAGTLALMAQFYDELRTAPTKAAALRQAQIALLRGAVHIEVQGQERGLSNLERGNILPADLLPSRADFIHPYYWAAFTLVGNPW